MKQNLIFFVYNNAMNSYLTDPISKFIKDEFNIILLHTSELSKDLYQGKLAQNSTDYQQIDISNYSVFELSRLLKKIKPVATIFFTYQAKYDFLLLELCNYFNIKTIYHDHGILYGDKPMSIKRKLTNKNWSQNFKFLTHLLSLSLVTKNLKIIFTFYKVIVNRNFKLLTFSKYIIFSEHNFSILNKILTINKKDLTITGFPLFINNKELEEIKSKEKLNKILYFHQPFIKYNITNINFNQEIEYFKKLSTIALKNGFTFEIRFHPSAEIDKYAGELKKFNIIINSEINLAQACTNTSLIFGHWSTAMLIGLPLEIPIFILKYPEVKPEYEHFYKIFNNVGSTIDSEDNLSKMLMKSKNFTKILDNFKENEYLIGKTVTYEENSNQLIEII